MDPASRSITASRAETIHLVLPGSANALGTIFGGVVMQWIDEIAAVAATRHASGPVVTKAVDALEFIAPIHVGDLVVLRAQVNAAFRSSMEVGVRVDVEDPRGGICRKTTKAYLTFIAIDGSGDPREVPALVGETPEDARRQAAAQARRALRLAARRR